MKHTIHDPDNSQNNYLQRVGEVKTQPSPETLRQEAEMADWLCGHGVDLEIPAGEMAVWRRRLLSRIERDARRSRWERFWAIPRFRIAANLASLAMLVLTLVFFFSALFSAARVALPGEALYAVKLGIEQVRVGLSVGDAQRAALHVAYARERSNELQALLIEGEYAYVEMASLRLLEQVDTARAHLARPGNFSRANQLVLVQDLNQTLSMQRLVLQALVHTTPVESQPMVRHVLLAAH